MSFAKSAVLALSLCSFALSAPTPATEFIVPTDPVDSTSTACGDIIIGKEQGYRIFWASDAFECLKNVPFDPAVGTRFIKYYNQTLQFQSTLELLKATPEGYQQPSIDVVQELWQIQAKIDAGVYQNQYVFEAEVQLFINKIHDAHVYLQAGIMAPFTFASPYGLVSVSENGKKVPEIYIRDDIVQSREEGWTPSPVKKINGVDVIEYLTTFAELNSVGYLEPNADWNSLLENPSLDIQGSNSVLQSAVFYPGDELTFSFGNDSDPLETFWLALFDEPYHTGPLTTPGDFYNYFVMGLTPASFDDKDPNHQWWPNDDPEDPDDTEETPDPTYGCDEGNPSLPNWCLTSYGAYPNDPIVSQDELSVIDGGVVTGYILEDISTGVLSIPSFWQTYSDTQEFFSAVDTFLETTKEKKIKKIIIDLQRNSGGLTLLALSVYQRFFFNNKPYTGSRIRSHELANTLGNTYSEWWDSLEVGGEGALNPLYTAMASSEWVVTNRINEASGKNFTNWNEYSGPTVEHSAVQEYNLSDVVFDAAAFQRLIPYGYGDSTDPGEVWKAEDIVLLTDGLCSSACAYFVELMSHQAGVKTVVVGGRPSTGPMQTASGNRGARFYSSDAIDVDFDNVKDMVENEKVADSLPSRADRGMWINYAGINIRDQLRKGDDSDTPLQFKYDAADCRIYYTLDNIYNMTRLWRDAAAATWSDTSLCVEDSTGYSSRASDGTPPKAPPPRAQQNAVIDLGFIAPTDLRFNTTASLINFGARVSITDKDISNCVSNTCGGTTDCIPLKLPCGGSNSKKEGTVSVCLPKCSTFAPTCPGDMECEYTRNLSTKKRLPPGKNAKKTTFGGGFDNYQEGNCVPPTINVVQHPLVGCPK